MSATIAQNLLYYVCILRSCGAKTLKLKNMELKFLPLIIIAIIFLLMIIFDDNSADESLGD